MFDKLKSLLLTVFLTILIWMYAESQVSSSRGEATLTVKGVPVTLSGPPDVLKEVLNQSNVVLDPPDVSVQVAGAPDRIDALRQRALGGGAMTGIRAYVEFVPEDRGMGSGVMLSRSLRVVAPEGIFVLQAPERITVRLTAKPPAGTAQGMGDWK